ncbi:MAG: hypothetical protein AB7D57_00760 [Desulfovibrionaceae bacterium]
MAESVVSICNAALLDLGADVVASLDDGSANARRCNQLWPRLRDEVLRKHSWSCCMSMAELAAGATAPVWKWAHRYPLPADLLRVWEVADAQGGPVREWEVQGRALLCDAEAPIYIAYVRRETDPQKYDATLGAVLAARLAAALAYPVTASGTMAQAKWAEYEAQLREARGINAREGGRTQEAQATGTWLAAKLGGA